MMAEKVYEEVRKKAATVARLLQEYFNTEWRVRGVTPAYFLSAFCARMIVGPEVNDLRQRCLQDYITPLLSISIFRMLDIEDIEDLIESFGFRDVTPNDLTPETRRALAKYLFWKEDIDDPRIAGDPRVAIQYIADKLISPRVDYYDFQAWLGVYAYGGFIVIFKLFYDAIHDEITVRYRVFPSI